ncbi:MAG TPA: EAL domain-containing protein [Pilimelia sp.]|nr:EAL domain-containing protein [Pilimelia sp.]
MPSDVSDDDWRPVEEPSRDITAAPARQPWWSRPDARVAALSLLVGLAAVVSTAALAAGGVALPQGAMGQFGLPGLVLLFAVTEGFAIHLRVRRGGHALSLTEIPMVLALLSLDPTIAVLARVTGGGAGLLLLRRQRGAKLGFNLALIGVQSAVAAAVFGALGDAAPQLTLRVWLASYAAMLLADMAAVVLVTAAISLHDDPGEWRRLPAAMRGVPLVAIGTTIALVSGLAVERNHWAALLLAIVSVVLFLAYRAYLAQHQGHAQVDQLYAFTRALDGTDDTDDLVRVILGQARDQLRAEHAELVVLPGDGQPARRTTMSGPVGTITQSLERAPEYAWWTPALAGQAVLDPVLAGESGGGMAVPVPLGEVNGALIVSGCLPDIGGFDSDGLRLFQALANHASVSLAKASLVDRLRQEAEEKEYLALHDPLTGLPNRRLFQGLLDAALDAARHDDNGPAVILLDLDRFKEVNDALGHDTGDAVLGEVSTRLQERIGTRGRVARLGGDEFALLLPRVHSIEEALSVGGDIARELERPVQLGPLSLNARASIGIAVAPVHGDDTQTLLRRADVAMYAAKGSRTGLRVYLPEDDQNTPHRLALITDLRETIRRRDLLVVFQPKLDPHTGAVTGAEALARWHHPEHGNIPPDQFIPLAEHSGLVRPLTLHVLEVALRRCAAWRRAGHDLHVAVNLSPNSLLDPSLPDLVSRLLSQTGTPASALTLEITESTIMADQEGSLATLNRLNELGVKLSIDDFGTGYSSLGRLRELPIHEVKIDKSFVQRIAIDHRDRAVVRSAVQLGHALDLEVVAEGVEDQDTYNYLAREGCNIVQGYLISRPLPPDEFSAWLSNRAAGNVIHQRFSA